MELNEEKLKELLQKEPFTRGMEDNIISSLSTAINVGDTEIADKPDIKRYTISQSVYAKELDPAAHDIHSDKNVPSIVVKLDKGNYQEIKDTRMALAYQRKIVEKQVLYTCGKPTKFTLCNTKPSKEQKSDYIDIKTAWRNKNYDIIRTEAIEKQKSIGDAAVLQYMKDGKVMAKTFSYLDGYTLIPIFDKFGYLEQFCFLYSQRNKRKLDVYDKEYFYEYILGEDNTTATLINTTPHGFRQVPVSYIRKEVAWENAQSIIEVLEIIYNIYSVIMKRHGWGLLYIKGNVDSKMKKLAGSVILQDNSDNPNSTAEFKAPPTPTGMENLISDLRKQIQIMTGTIFITPEDVRMSGDISGAAIKMMNSSAYEKAMKDAMGYDDFMDSMLSIFIEGYANEMKRSAQYSTLNIRAELDVWIPQSDTEIVTNLTLLKNSNLISTESGTEISPYSTPDEIQRIESEKATAIKETNQQQTNINNNANNPT